MKRAVIIILLLFGFGVSNQYYSQTGGKKREKRTKKRGNHILTQYKSHGHADDFAKGSSGRFSRFSKLFKRTRPSWQNRSTTKLSNNRENRNLFARFRQRGHIDNAESQARASSDRSKHRDRGSKSFKRRKYKR